MRLLVLTHEFAPQPNPRAKRWTAITGELAKRGHEIDVVCGVPGADGDAPRVRVHRVCGWQARLRQRFGRGGGSRASAGAAGRSSLSWRTLAARSLQGLNRAVVKPVQWPDYAAGWARPALRRATDLLTEKRYDAVVSVSNPFTGHLVGLRLKRRFPSLRWIADIGDPLSIDEHFRCNNTWLFGRANRQLESSVLHEADRTTIVTPTMVAKYRAAFPAAADRVAMVQPLLATAAARLPAPLDHPVRRLAYFGTLYRGLRSPQPLFDLLESLTKTDESRPLELHLFGNVNDCATEVDRFRQRAAATEGQLQLITHGLVDGERVAAETAAADVLVNVGNAIPYGLPSKVVEYAATGRPVLNVAHSREDTSAVFLDRHPAAVTVFADELVNASTRPAAVERVRRFFEAPPAVSQSAVDRLLAPHRVENVAAVYEELLDVGNHVRRRAA